MDWIDFVIRDICEIPYRDSPSDMPEAMVVTPAELRAIIERRLEQDTEHSICAKAVFEAQQS